MATFDPNVQLEGPPNLPNIHPIQQPMTDVSGEIRGKAKGAAFKEAGSLLAEGAQLADKTQKQYIYEGMSKQTEELNTQMIEHLGAIDKLYKGGYQNNVLGQGDSNKDISPELSSFPGIVDDLVALRDTGKPSLIYYQMQRNSIASQWRGAHAGQRAFIDSTMERLTNEPAANKVISQMVQDISAQAGALKQEREKTTNIVVKGIEEFNMDPKYLRDIQQGKPGAIDAGLKEFHRLNADHSANEATKLDIDAKIKKNEYDKLTATQDADKWMAGQVSKAIRDFNINFEPFQSHNIIDLYNEIYVKKEEMPDEAAQLLTRKIEQYSTALANRLQFEGDQPLNKNDPNSQTRSSAMGAENYKKLIADKVEPFTRLSKLLTDKEKFPLGMAQKDKLEAIGSAAGLEVLKRNPGLAALAAVSKMEGPRATYVADMFAKMEVRSGDMDASLKVLGKDTIAKLAGGTFVWKGPDGGPFTLGQYATEAKEDEMTAPRHAPLHSAVTKAVTDTLNDPKADPVIRKNMAEAAFSQKDADTLMSKFPKSEYKNSKITTGQSTLLSDLVNPEVTKNIKKLGDAATTKNYVESAEKYAGHVVWNEIQQLNTVNLDPEAHIEFDSKSGHFTYTPPQQNIIRRIVGALATASGEDTSALSAYNASQATEGAVTKINMAIDSYSAVAELTHKTVPEFMLHLFLKNGMDPMLAAKTMVGPVLEALKHSAPKQQPTDTAGEL